jgi:hypothetical protein
MILNLTSGIIMYVYKDNSITLKVDSSFSLRVGLNEKN